MSNQRGEFGSRTGFILAAAGSAIGLGNIWRFPYVAGENGGGAFLVLYIAMVFTVGLSIMLAEIAIGRATRRNPVGAFAALKGGAWTGVGYMGVLAGFVILSFYSVIGGWTLAYTWATLGPLLKSSNPDAMAAHFEHFISDPTQTLVYHGLFMAMTITIVMGGIEKGIERAAKLLMPVLFIMLVALCLRAVTLPGAWQGVEFFTTPDWSRVTAGTFNAALSQAFFSLSLGMGALLTYGSYLSKHERLPSVAIWVTSLDTLMALMAGLMILPAVFAFGYNPAAGPGLTFITLPAVFAQMPGGTLFGPLFFALLAVAALTSAVSLLETVVAYTVDEKGTNRKPATIAMGTAIFFLGVPSAMSLGPWADIKFFGKTFLNLMDYLASNLLMPLGGIAIAIFAGWVVGQRMREEVDDSGKAYQMVSIWLWVLRTAAPGAVIWILLSGL
jgi:neurotransmitter:Na+ symporter, NSS family